MKEKEESNLLFFSHPPKKAQPNFVTKFALWLLGPFLVPSIPFHEAFFREAGGCILRAVEQEKEREREKGRGRDFDCTIVFSFFFSFVFSIFFLFLFDFFFSLGRTNEMHMCLIGGIQSYTTLNEVLDK